MILILLLPRHISAVLLLSLVGVAVVYFSWMYLPAGRALILKPEGVTPPVLKLPERGKSILWAAELIFITLITLNVTDVFWDNNPDQTLPGREVEWQVNTGYYAAQALREHGYIPLWNPWLEYGHPLIDNAQSFVLNPLASVPSLLWGGVRGIKLGVGIHALLAAWGGWFLGRVLNLGSVGRVLLALLLLGKGNMLAMFGAGYYQLALAQAYFPWIVAGTLAMLRDEGRRWPIGLTAVALTLQFWGGTVWYSLPMVLTIGLLAVAYSTLPSPHFVGEGQGVRGKGRYRSLRSLAPTPTLRPSTHGIFHWRGLQNLLLAGLFTVGLSAITLIPLWLQREYLGAHPDDTTGGKVVDLGKVIEQFYNGDIELYERKEAPGELHFYYSFVSPLWFLLILFVLLPPIPKILHRESQSHTWRLWVIGMILMVVMTLWGAGGNSIIVWLYQHMPLLGQWRFVGRALGVASFWIGVLIAMRVDGLWRVIWQMNWYRLPVRIVLVSAAQVILSGLLVLVSWTAAREVIHSWEDFAGTVSRNTWRIERDCLTWLREQKPEEYLAAYQYGYDSVIAYEENHIVMADIEADFEPLPIEFTLSHRNVTQTRPEYAIAWTDDIRRVVADWGYKPVAGSPRPVDKYHCLYRRNGALDFAYTVRLSTLQTYFGPLKPSQTFPVTVIERLPDRIRLEAQASAAGSRVVVVQQLAHPGWQVKVDGKTAYLESVGGLIGVLLPRDSQNHTVEFAYRPPLVYRGGVLTMLTCVVLSLYLLRADRLLKILRHKKGEQLLDQTGQDTVDQHGQPDEG